ncbi:MAG: hypothetical protein ACJ71Y_09685 [Blastococcus sp.]
MWSAPLGSDPDQQRWSSAPDNEIPVAVPLNVVLARTEDLALAVLGLQAYSSGIAFTLVGRVRPEAASRLPLVDAVWGSGDGRTLLLLGVEFADGRRASTAAGHGSSRDGLILNPAGGAGSETSVEQSWWVHPLPPEGPLRLVIRSDDLGVPESAVELDGAAIRAAGASVRELWPWAAPRPEPLTPEPTRPDLPADSWFAS